ncbi:prephenate dehydrogenase [Desulforamulus ruminis]|uniref:prephenate dehydrogenase n=1 Tax=Desulforamulus ruminis TaxID=1564 RepID=UPI0023555FEE|nr:prephenate dehydrogenase/arogenate dehydrogenase family protein [Desulforamulus ruminis]
MFNKVVIAGVGLIGGSLGLAMIRRNLAREVVGVDPAAENLALAERLGAVHRAGVLAEVLPGAELFILAAPIGVTLGVLEMAIPYLTSGTIVTDVGSVKGRLLERARKMVPEGVYLVGGHPMAGLEVAGVAGAREDLFEGASYVLTPDPHTHPLVLDKLKKLIQGIGANPVEMAAGDHDRAVAAISHLPHLLAATLVNTVTAEPNPDRLLKLAGGGFRDTTRIAASNASMWRDILLTNRDRVLEALRQFRGQLEEMEQAIENFDSQQLVYGLERARNVRAALPENRTYLKKR